EISAAPTPALTWRRVMRWVMVFLPNSLGLCRRDARAGQECGSTLSNSGTVCEQDTSRSPTSFCVFRSAKDVGKPISIYFGIACPPKASVVAFDFAEIGTFRSQLLTNIHQFTGRV